MLNPNLQSDLLSDHPAIQALMWRSDSETFKKGRMTTEDIKQKNWQVWKQIFIVDPKNPVPTKTIYEYIDLLQLCLK